MAKRRPKPPPLYPGRALQFHADLAKHAGWVASVLLARIHELQHGDGAARREVGGRSFVRFTPRAMAEELHHVSPKTIGRAVNRLVRLGLLLRAKVRGEGPESKVWFAVDTDVVAAVGTLFPLTPQRPPSKPPSANRGNAKRSTEDQRGERP